MPIPLLALLLGGGGAGLGAVGAGAGTAGAGAGVAGAGAAGLSGGAGMGAAMQGLLGGGAGMGTSVGTSGLTGAGIFGAANRGVNAVDQFIGGLEGRGLDALGRIAPRAAQAMRGTPEAAPAPAMPAMPAMPAGPEDFSQAGYKAAQGFGGPSVVETTAANARLIADLMASLRRR